jgi:hypothetical protein
MRPGSRLRGVRDDSQEDRAIHVLGCARKLNPCRSNTALASRERRKAK